MSDLRQSNSPDRRILLCLDGCRGEFYYPLADNETPTCPVDGKHDVALYSAPTVYRFCDDCGTEMGLARAGYRRCERCELEMAE